MMVTREDILTTLGNISPEARVRALRQALSEVEQDNARHRYPNPGTLACDLHPDTVQTPALDVIDQAVADTIANAGRLIVTIPPQEGKAHLSSTPVWTPTGWRRHGDLHPGDTVYHPDGHTVTVTDKHPDCEITLRVHFGDHFHLDCHPRHEFTVYDRTRGNYRTVEAQHLADTKLMYGTPGKRGSRYRFSLPHREALHAPDADLTIPPYLLGLWLGNGQKHTGMISRDPRNDYPYDWPVLSTRRHDTTGVLYDTITGLTHALREQGQIAAIKQPENKHIPADYLTASEQQRRALLAGLIDTDGHIPATGNQISFDNTNESLVRDTAHLARTLGYRAHVHAPTDPKDGGTINGHTITGTKPIWRATFNVHDGVLPTRIKRHRDGKMSGDGQRRRTPITAVEHITPTVGNCITVDSPDGLYLAGEGLTPTHNSTRIAVWTPVWALMRNPEARIVVASYAESLAARNAYNARAIVNEFGSGAVDEVTGSALPDHLGIEVAHDHRQQRSWGLHNNNGGYYSTGTGGALTGRAADCVSKDTVILTDRGPLTAEDAYRHPPRHLLSYNHKTRRSEWRRLEATRRIAGRSLVTIETDTGEVLTCTPDHLVYAGGRYTPAGSVRPGDTLLQASSSDAVPPMRRTVRRPSSRRAQGDTARAVAPMLPGVLYPVEGRSRADELLSSVRRPRPPHPENDMQRTLPPRDTAIQGTAGDVQVVREDDSCEIVTRRILRHDVCRSGALGTDDRSGEQSLHAVNVTTRGVPQDAGNDHRAGREPVRGVRCYAEAHGASPQRGLAGQPARESRDGMRDASHGAPPCREVTVCRVVPAGIGDVYDFQVEGNENFFADGLLVHNCLIIDDPFKNQTQADSAREREKVWEWWTSVAQTRLAPGAAVIIVMTRWHESDLVGQILAEEEKRPEGEKFWRVVNIPAVAEAGVPDALGREPGTAMKSARGRSPEEFARIRDAVGPRVWGALYQGTPTPTEGGLFARDEFDRSRVESVELAGRVVSVDPAETGHGDEAGILVMGWGQDATLYVEDDLSGRYTSAQWSRVAVRAAVARGASEIVYEAFTAEQTYRDVLTSTWRDIARQAELLRANGLDTVVAAEQWYREGHEGDTLTPMQRTLEIVDLIPEDGSMPFRLAPWRKRGDKVARAAGARQSVTTGRLRMVGTHPVLERQAVEWQPGQGSPDRVDAMVNGHDHLMGMFGRPTSIAVPEEW